MRRREVAVILGVLLPFAALVAAGLFWTRARPAPPPPRPAPRASSPPALEVPPHAPPAAAAPAPPDGGAPLAVEDPPPPELEAPLRAVAAQVHQCFLDQPDRIRRVVRVRVAFRPLPDGGFEGAVVEGTTWQDPFLTACIEDVFAELPYTPDGRQTFTRATHTFVYDPAAR